MAGRLPRSPKPQSEPHFPPGAVETSNDDDFPSDVNSAQQSECAFARISSVAKIGDHLQSADTQRETFFQSADTQRETASETIELKKFLKEFNGSSPGYLVELLHSCLADARLADAALIAQKLRSFAEQDFGRYGIPICNEMENRLLSLFDAASQKRELTTMAECSKIWSQFNRGTSAMQHYVATRPMFIDVEIMNVDSKLILGDQAAQASPCNVARGLSSLYKEITDTVRKEAATITAVFPSPSEVMSILVQRVLEQRITALLDKLLEKPSLVNLPSMEEGGLLLYLRMLAVAYEKIRELARDLQAVGCGDLDVEGLTESLFSSHKDEYPEYEQASLRQLYKMKMEELRAESQQISDSSGTIGRSKGASAVSSQQQISVTVVTEFVRWNEEAISRCNLFASQPAALATHVKAVFTCLLDQVSQYIADGLERASDSLTEASNLRERFVLGRSGTRRVAAAAASAAEVAAAAGESSFTSFMIDVQRSGSCVAIIQHYFANSISWLLLPVDGAHVAACEEMDTAMSSAEAAAYKGLQQCIKSVMAEVERLLSAEQKATVYRSPDDAMAPDHRATSACTRVVAYVSRVLEFAFPALEGLNQQAFWTELAETGGSGIVARRVAGQAGSDEYVTKIPNNKAEEMHIDAANVTPENSDSDYYESDYDTDASLYQSLYPSCSPPPDMSFPPPPDTRENSVCCEIDDDKDCQILYPSFSPPPDTNILCSIENMPTRPVSRASPMANQHSSVRSKAEEMHIDAASVTRENSVNNLQPDEISDHVSGQGSYDDMCIELSVLHFLDRPISRSRIDGIHRDVIAEELGISLDKLRLAIKNLKAHGLIEETEKNQYSSNRDFTFVRKAADFD